jgi:hypothetical protein
MRAAWAVVGGILGSLIMVALGDLVSEEVRVRLDRLPFGLIRLAGRRLPVEMRDDRTEEWVAELHEILRGAEALPVTRLLSGVSFAVSALVWGAPRIRRESVATVPLGIELTEPRSVILRSILEKAQDLVSETVQATSLHLERAGSTLAQRSEELLETEIRIGGVEDESATVQGQMGPLRTELDRVLVRKKGLAAKEARIRNLEVTKSGTAERKRSLERRENELKRRLARPQDHDKRQELTVLETRERTLKDPWLRKQELRKIAMLRREITRGMKHLWYSPRELDDLEAQERALKDPRIRERELRCIAHRKRELSRQLELRLLLVESLEKTYEEYDALDRRSEQIGRELYELRRDKTRREAELQELERRGHELRAQLAPFEDMARMLKEERRYLKRLAWRQRSRRRHARRQVQSVERSRRSLEFLSEGLESALVRTSISNQSVKLIRDVWWYECARRRALQQVDGLGSEMALEYNLYRALKLAGREAGRQVLVVVLITAWLGRLLQSFGYQSRRGLSESSGMAAPRQR